MLEAGAQTAFAEAFAGDPDVHVPEVVVVEDPGSFRLLPDGRLAVLGFGSTERLPRGWPDRLGPLLAAQRDGDSSAAHALAVSVGLAGVLTSLGARVPVDAEVRRAVPGYVCSPVRAGRLSGQA